MPKEIKENWEKEFDKRWPGRFTGKLVFIGIPAEELKSFIRQLLKSEKENWQKELKPTFWYERGLYDATKSVKKELAKKIEKKKKKCKIIDYEDGRPVEEYFCQTYNQAIEEILKLLKEK